MRRARFGGLEEPENREQGEHSERLERRTVGLASGPHGEFDTSLLGNFRNDVFWSASV